MTHDVFISYSHHDKSAADAVCAKLEQHGVRCWIAPRDVEPGTEWAGSIIRAISSTKIMILVFSKNANDSPQIRKEVERAVNKGVIVVPLRIEDVVPTESLEYFMSNVHWLDALTPPLEKHLDNLAGNVKIILERMVNAEPPPLLAPSTSTPVQPDPPAPVAPPPQPPMPQQSPVELLPTKSTVSPVQRSSRRPMVIAGFATLIVLFIAAYFIWKSTLPPQFVKDHTLTGSLDYVSALAFSPDGRWLASGDGSFAVHMWDLATSQQIWSVPCPAILNSIAFSPDGHSLAIACSLNSLSLRDAATGRPTWSAPAPLDGSISRVAFSPDGHALAAASIDNGVHNVKLWDAASGRIVRTLTGHTDWIYSIAFSRDGRWLAAGSYHGTIKLWDSATGEEIRTLTANKEAIESVAFSPDGHFLTSASTDGSKGTLYRWDLNTGRLVTSAKFDSSFYGIGYSPDGRLIATGDWNHNIELWNAATFRILGTLPRAHTGWITSVAFSPDNRWLATGARDDNSIILWRRTN